LSKVQAAENFAKERHIGMIRKDSNISHHDHLTAVVTRLKNLGVTDEDTLSAAWLQDIIDYTSTSFDELDQRFGSKVAVLVLSMSKDKSIPRSMQEEQYVKQLKESTLDAKLIKLCDISSSIKDLKNSSFSRTRKMKEMKKKLYYLNVIKTDLIKNKDKIPGIAGFMNGVNDTITSHGLRPVVFQ
jgi:(p)ppGpp synthase/HD superfamily hydrolase